MYTKVFEEYNTGMFGESIKFGHNNGAQQHENVFKMCELTCVMVSEGDQFTKCAAFGGGQHALKTSDGE
eukprot:5970759-Ditylum_brightwellii.AAC.2